LAEFEQALLEDSPARVAAAGATLSPHATFMMFVVFDNLPLAVVVSIESDRLEVTADSRPSSLEEWMTWGTAGWEKFAGQSPPTGLSSWLTRLFRMGRPE
jgi:hypothetical protein